jgi:hypothetical protein
MQVHSEQRSGAAGSTRRLVEDFVAMVRELPYVRQVRLDERSADGCVWTLIDALPSDDEQRDEIYDAELRASQHRPAAALDFRLVNAAEYPGANADDLLATEASVLLMR